MKRVASYTARAKCPRACIDPGDPWNEDWSYNAGDRHHIEAHEQEEGEEWEDTGILDLRGNPIWRITKYVRRPIGFVLSNDE